MSSGCSDGLEIEQSKQELEDSGRRISQMLKVKGWPRKGRPRMARYYIAGIKKLFLYFNFL